MHVQRYQLHGLCQVRQKGNPLKLLVAFSASLEFQNGILKVNVTVQSTLICQAAFNNL